MNDNEFLAPVDVISTDKQLMESPELETISKKIIKEYNLDFGPAEIGFFWYIQIFRNKELQNA